MQNGEGMCACECGCGLACGGEEAQQRSITQGGRARKQAGVVRLPLELVQSGQPRHGLLSPCQAPAVAPPCRLPRPAGVVQPQGASGLAVLASGSMVWMNRRHSG